MPRAIPKPNQKPADWNGRSSMGRVRRLYVSEGFVGIKLRTYTPSQSEPKSNGEFKLSTSHSNYNSLYSTLLACAANQWQVLIRTSSNQPEIPDISAEQSPEILYIMAYFDNT
jgi:hypothetical protein